ncbi:MAG: BREX-6 system phosphatase PglZ, partial [Deltaproteobacteria bacterium]|nr:BREX-6 system phosphatase PglZ [Deltaproteobacteria bacterium]
AFLANEPSLEEADRWLAAAMSGRSEDLLRFLEDVGPAVLVEALGGDPSVLQARIDVPEKLAAFQAYLHALTGLDEPWVRQFTPERADTPLRLPEVLSAAGAWLLSVEYVHDLRRPPHLEALMRLRDLDAPIVRACRGVVEQLRARHPDAYVRLADEVESFVAAELRLMSAEDLGQVDTFREEENRVLAGAVEALALGDWAKAKAWCHAREGDRSFWLKRDQTRRWAWNLVAEAAEFGTVLTRHERPLRGARSLEEATERYAVDGYLVDGAHRRFEQRRLALLEPRLPYFGALKEVVGSLRARHRAWADDLARDFTGVCKEHGFLPPDSLQQRTLFEQVVVPLLALGEKVALFMVDAFRYEMAAELVEDFEVPGTIVDLKPRLAELPTITPVGMNALAPVAQAGRLHVAGVFQGFKTGEYTVNRPDTRARAMGLRTVSKAGISLKLGEIGEAKTTELKRKLAPHTLVIVHSTEIDDAGEANVGLASFESTLQQLKAARQHLQLAGVKHFVFTADHGFLLQDETTRIQPYGKKTDPSRRHVLDEHPREEAGMLPVSLKSLGYEGLEGYLLLREDTASFATGTVGASFVHGGNSPQERIIPVLTVTRPRAEGRSLAECAIEAEALPDVVGLHRLRVRLVLDKERSSLGFTASSRISVALRVPERADITTALRDATGAGTLQNGRLQLPVSQTWTELFFALEGPRDERARVELHHPDGVETVRAAMPEAWFSVGSRLSRSAPARPETPRPTRRPSKPPPVETTTTTVLAWADAFETEAVRKVFVHIEKHGAITEPEVTQFLGSPRAFRTFSREFDGYLLKLPFKVRVESGEGGKRYVKDN